MNHVEGRQRLLITRHRNHAVHDPRALRRAVRTGEMIKLWTGAYVRGTVWNSLSPTAQDRLTIAAAVDATSTGLVVSHRSAAILWGVPLLGRHDGLVHARTSVAAGTRTEHGFRKHATADLDQHVVAATALTVTSLERTVVDLALSEPFASGVVAVDWLLRAGTTKDDLYRILDEAGPKQWRGRAERAIDFGDAASGSVGESWSRTQMEEAGLVIPELQTRFFDGRGFIGAVDFYWPQFNLVGEFDGIGKFTDPTMLAGREPREALADEKRREDRLRATDRRPNITRWLWEVLPVAGSLPAILLRAGVRRR